MELVPAAKALEMVLDSCETLEAEKISIDSAIGRVLRQEIVAPYDFPRFHRVMMDGFALRAEDVGADCNSLPLAGEIAAGDQMEIVLKPNTCLRIMTGAPLPQGADAVVPHEETQEKNGQILFLRPVIKGQHIANQGEEAKAGQTLLNPGDIITAIAVAVMAASGYTQVNVSRMPSLAIVTTGNEVVPADSMPGKNQIRDSNSWSLAAQAQAEGISQLTRSHVLDDEAAMAKVLSEALRSDIVIVAGGVAEGKYDLAPTVLKSLGVKKIFHQVAQKPGKPLWFGKKNKTIVFGAPGNPLATLITFDLFVRPAIAKMTGKKVLFPTFDGKIMADVAYKTNRNINAFVKAVWEEQEYSIYPLHGCGSADVFHQSEANALMQLPAGKHEFRKGQIVKFRFIGLTPGV